MAIHGYIPLISCFSENIVHIIHRYMNQYVMVKIHH